jgi:hypothetical protein
MPVNKTYKDFVEAKTSRDLFTIPKASTMNYDGSAIFGVGSKWWGGALAPNGKIYGIPNSTGSSVLVIDPKVGTATTFSSAGGSYRGGSLAPNGKIYTIPDSSTNTILEIDPDSNTSTTFGNLSAVTKGWSGGVLAPNGKIYGIPHDATTVLEIDPVARTATTFGGTLSGATKWDGGVLAPNGKIYAIPSSSTSILKIDPVAQTATTFGSITSGYSGGVLHSNGKIYAVREGVNYDLLQIDPSNDTVSIVSISITGIPGGSWRGGVLGANGKMYFIPAAFSASNPGVLEVDIISSTASLIYFADLSASGPYNTKTYTNGWAGGVLAPNGKIYGFPYTSTNILLELGERSAQTPGNWLLSAYQNTF